MSAQPKKLIELKRNNCRWICEEPNDQNNHNWLYCGENVNPNSSYCSVHHAIVFVKPTEQDNRVLKIPSRMLK